MAAFILFRVILSVSANAVQKRLLVARAGIYHTWILTYLLMIGPAILAAGLHHTAAIAPGFWTDIVLGGALDALGNLAMVAALRTTDLSIFGPLNAIRPILALLFGWFWLHERPTPAGVAGVAVTVLGGVILFTDAKSHPGGNYWVAIRALCFRVTGLSLGVAGAVFLKRAASVGTAEMTVAAWIAAGLVVLCGSALLHRKSDLLSFAHALRVHGRWLLLHASVFISMQWLTIRIFQGTLLAYSFVYFQLAMVLQVLVGRYMFKETSFARRLIASVIMAAGSVLVLWKG